MTLFEKNSQSIMNLVIALAGNQSANSPTELVLNPLYKFRYSSIFDAIDNFRDAVLKPKAPEATAKAEEVKPKTPAEKATEELENQMAVDAKLRLAFKEFFPEKTNGKFFVLNTDSSSNFREHSPTLEDKEFVYAPNTVIKGNKPVSIGYRFSTVGINAQENGVAWNPPISMLKIPCDQKSSQFAAQQIKLIFAEEELLGNNLVLNNLDCAYNNTSYTYPTYDIPNLVNIIRISGNRNVYHQYDGTTKTGKGAKNRYGNVFKLSDNQTHTKPDQTEQFELTMKNGRQCKVNLSLWKDKILNGKRNQKMHDKPFHLISVELTDIQTGKPIYQKILWLTVWGQRRNEITLREIYESYRKRFDIEFFFRFGKQKLLLDQYQTPDVEHQQNWYWFVMLAYWVLYVSRFEGENVIRPWEKYEAKYKNQDIKDLENKIVKTPTQTQRAMQAILCDFAKNNLIPKPRNIYSGRKKGDKKIPRQHFPVVKKGGKLQI